MADAYSRDTGTVGKSSTRKVSPAALEDVYAGSHRASGTGRPVLHVVHGAELTEPVLLTSTAVAAAMGFSTDNAYTAYTPAALLASRKPRRRTHSTRSLTSIASLLPAFIGASI